MPSKPTKQSGLPALRKRKPPKAMQPAVQPLEQPKAKAPAQPVASPQEHAQAAQQLKEWAATEADPKVAERLNSLASLNEAFSRAKPSPPSTTA